MICFNPTFHLRQRTSISEGIVDQRRYNSNFPPSPHQLGFADVHYVGLGAMAIDADSWGSGGAAYFPLSVVQMVLFTDVLGVQQQRRCGGGEISESHKFISNVLISY
jgi:hypothetical protein